MSLSPPIALAALFCGSILAQDADTDSAEPTAADPPVEQSEPDTLNPVKRAYLMEVNLRTRYLSAPDPIVDIWFFDEGDSPGVHPDRPKLHGATVGLEWVVKKDQNNGVFYFEYAGSLLNEGYWDDREDDPIYTDGDYIVPDGFGFISLGGTYLWEHKANAWVSFLAGGGLGFAITTGELTRWVAGPNATGDPQCTQDEDEVLVDPRNAPAYERYEAGCGSDGAMKFPGLLPVVNGTLGVRFDFAQRANVRLEAGVHNLFYVGMASGIVF